jgi:hypothetical protein
MAPISTPSHGRRFGMHARALLSVSKTIQTHPPVGGYPRGCTFPKSETVELPANDAWLVLAPPELDRVIFLAPQHQ